jgi:ABC-type Fe3+ transport system permease subunit
VTVANSRIEGGVPFPGSGRLAGLRRPSTLALIACVLIALWFVLVPLWALFYNAFTEDTGFGPGAFSLDNFVEAYASWSILGLFRNSLIFAIGTALTTFVLGGFVSWAVERTDAPGPKPVSSVNAL